MARMFGPQRARYIKPRHCQAGSTCTPSVECSGSGPRRAATTLLVIVTSALASPAINHHHRVLRHQLLRADVQMRVSERADIDDVGFTNLDQEIRHHLVKFIVADFYAVRV